MKSVLEGSGIDEFGDINEGRGAAMPRCCDLQGHLLWRGESPQTQARNEVRSVRRCNLESELAFSYANHCET